MKLTEEEIKASIGYRMQGFCCGNCKHKANLQGTSYNKDLLRCTAYKLDVSETSVCDNFIHWKAKVKN